MIRINWGSTYIIEIPQSYLTLISGTLYELDTNAFRLDLKALEASELGMPFPITHDHNTEYTVAGVTYARKVEILPPYSVEFEDGKYSVRLVGSNNNIFDVENGILVQNQVQVIPGNSAGLINADGNTTVGQEDWTEEEKEQIRAALGIDGTKTEATGGQLQDIPLNVWAEDISQSSDPNSAGYKLEKDKGWSEINAKNIIRKKKKK